MENVDGAFLRRNTDKNFEQNAFRNDGREYLNSEETFQFVGCKSYG